MTTTQLMDDLLHELTDEQRVEFRGVYGRIQRLPTSQLSLQEFLDEYLRLTVSLYAATAGAIWFRSPDGADVQLNTRIGMDRLGLTGEYEAVHRDLVAHAIEQRTPLLVKPFSAPHSHARVSNPTDSFIILGPAVARQQGIAVLELFLGPTPARGKSSGDRQRYVLWLDHLLGYFCQGIEHRFLGRGAPLKPAIDQLEATRSQIAVHQAEIRQGIEQSLRRFVGWSFGSLKDNQAFAKQVHQLLDEHGLRVECPECRSPAILRCQAAGNSKSGVFLFDHYLDRGRTFHGGRTTFPRLTLVGKPARRPRSEKPR